MKLKRRVRPRVSLRMEMKANVETKEVKFNFLFVGLEHYVFALPYDPRAGTKK